MNLLEQVRVILYYYPHFNFFKLDACLLLSYLFINPFRVSKRFLLQRGEKEIYVYGETPLTTLDLIARICQISARDVVFELGCGRGRTCFWLHALIGCSVVGIEQLPLFVEKAQQVKDRFKVQRVAFRLADLFKVDLKGATVVYLYGTCLSAEEINCLIKRFRQLPKGAKVITVSYALADYQPTASFQVVKCFKAPFTWGQADVYLQVKTCEG